MCSSWFVSFTYEIWRHVCVYISINSSPVTTAYTKSVTVLFIYNYPDIPDSTSEIPHCMILSLVAKFSSSLLLLEDTNHRFGIFHFLYHSKFFIYFLTAKLSVNLKRNGTLLLSPNEPRRFKKAKPQTVIKICGWQLEFLKWQFIHLQVDFWPIDAIWRHEPQSILVQVMTCCMKAPSHYRIQC